MKRVLCVLFLLPALLFSVQAVPNIDGSAGKREYGCEPIFLVPAQRESNNNVSFAFAFQTVSMADFSIYIGVHYVCDDVGVLLRETETETESGAPANPETTGLEVSLNGVVCCTALLDGSVDIPDTNRYDADAAFIFADDTDTDNPDTNNFTAEVRLGVKYGVPYDATLGLRILDCGGIPSNYYEIPINPSPQAEANGAEQQAAHSAAEKKAKAETTTKAAKTTETTTRAVSTSGTTIRTSARTSAASTARYTVTLAAVTSATVPQTEAAAVRETAGRQTTLQTQKRSTTSAASAASTSTTTALTEPTAAVSVTAQAVQPETTASLSFSQSALRSSKTIGIVIATVLLTAAVMTTVFIAAQKKTPPGPIPIRTDPEENDGAEDDF